MDKQALAVWAGHIVRKAKEIKYKNVYKKGLINLAFMQKLAQLSVEPDGVIKAISLLKEVGIGLVVEPHFPKTYLDGVVILTDERHPIIGLTIRHDRLDNFWFTLMHELAHISLHFNEDTNLFYDDLDSEDSNVMEREADQLARESLVPESKWENSPAKLIPSPIAAESLAKELKIHPAIVAGKMRYEGQNYQYLNKIVNQAKVQKYFPEIKWNKHV
jgi:HTH-type transcriptional regulator/antitoxin HigA